MLDDQSIQRFWAVERKLRAKPPVQRPKLGHPVDDDAPVRLAAEIVAGAGRLGGEFADDFLDDVLNRDEPLQLAIFVDDETQTLTVGLELLQLRQERRPGRDEIRRPQQGPQAVGVDFGRLLQMYDTLERQDADDVVERVLVDRYPRMVRRGQLLAEQRRLQAEIETVNLASRCHDVVDRNRFEIEQIGEHRPMLAAKVMAALEN